MLLAWARPQATAAYVLSTMAGTVLALVLLRQFAVVADRRQEEWLVSALAVAFGGQVLQMRRHGPSRRPEPVATGAADGADAAYRLVR